MTAVLEAGPLGAKATGSQQERELAAMLLAAVAAAAGAELEAAGLLKRAAEAAVKFTRDAELVSLTGLNLGVRGHSSCTFGHNLDHAVVVVMCCPCWGLHYLEAELEATGLLKRAAEGAVKFKRCRAGARQDLGVKGGGTGRWRFGRGICVQGILHWLRL
jgi:hypothetical protein